MKKINIIFWTIAFLIGSQCALFIFRGVSAVGSDEGVVRWMWIFKILTYFGIAGMGLLIFRIKIAFQQQGFFDEGNVRQLRHFGFLALVAALFNSLANAAMETAQFFHREVSFHEAQDKFIFSFAEQVFDHSLIVYVLVLSILLLTNFTRRAIAIKGENEAFI